MRAEGTWYSFGISPLCLISIRIYSPAVSKVKGYVIFQSPHLAKKGGSLIGEVQWAFVRLLPFTGHHQNKGPCLICCENQIPERDPWCYKAKLLVNLNSEMKDWFCKVPTDLVFSSLAAKAHSWLKIACLSWQVRGKLENYLAEESCRLCLKPFIAPPMFFFPLLPSR